MAEPLQYIYIYIYMGTGTSPDSVSLATSQRLGSLAAICYGPHMPLSCEDWPDDSMSIAGSECNVQERKRREKRRERGSRFRKEGSETGPFLESCVDMQARSDAR